MKMRKNLTKIIVVGWGTLGSTDVWILVTPLDRIEKKRTKIEHVEMNVNSRFEYSFEIFWSQIQKL